MKKLLIATAALAVVAGTAQAQSSVTIYGIYAQGFVSTELGTAQAVGTMSSDRLDTGRLGFRGKEDLGGGLSAMFQLEGRLNGNGSLGYTDPAVGGNNIFDRLAYGGLTSKTLGTLTLGRQTDAVKEIEGLSIFQNMTDTHNVTTVGDRAANLTKYTSPNIQGLTFAVAYSEGYVSSSGQDAETGSGTQSAALTGTRHISYNAQYTLQGVKLAAARGTNNTTAGVESTTTRYSAQGQVMGATVGVSYTDNKLNAAGDKTDQLQISARVPLAMLGSGVSLLGSYIQNDAMASGATAGALNGVGYTAMLTKDLSKRTTLYAGYSSLDVDTAASDVVVTTIGLQHKF
jgi:predicted porin